MRHAENLATARAIATVPAMPAALILSLAQLGDRAFLRVLLRAVLLTLLIFAALGWGIAMLVATVDTSGWPTWLAGIWSGGGGGALTIGITILLLWLAFTGIATGVASLWLDEIIAAVEAKYYPAATGRPIGLRREVALGLRSGLRVLFWNLLLVPAYMLLIVTAIGPLVLFVIVNSWLLGRDYLEAVAARHRDPPGARAYAQDRSIERWSIGVVAAGLFALPLTGLIAPIIGIAVATHLYHRRP